MVSIENLKKEYPDFCLNISMEIPDGTIIGLVGKNGAGKSTTIKAILGLVKPDAGSVMVLGKEAKQLTAKDKEVIGVALSDSGFSVYLNVANISRILKKMYKTFDEKKFEEQCKRFGLPTHKPIRQFSTGMKAKLRVLVALSHDAKLLIMDEPTAGLDIEARNEILDMLREYITQDESRSVLLTSHISTDLEGLCDEIYLLHDGKMILHEDTDVILDQYAILKMDEEEYDGKEQNSHCHIRRMSGGYRLLCKQDTSCSGNICLGKTQISEPHSGYKDRCYPDSHCICNIDIVLSLQQIYYGKKSILKEKVAQEIVRISCAINNDKKRGETEGKVYRPFRANKIWLKYVWL